MYTSYFEDIDKNLLWCKNCEFTVIYIMIRILFKNMFVAVIHDDLHLHLVDVFHSTSPF